MSYHIPIGREYLSDYVAEGEYDFVLTGGRIIRALPEEADAVRRQNHGLIKREIAIMPGADTDDLMAVMCEMLAGIQFSQDGIMYCYSPFLTGEQRIKGHYVNLLVICDRTGIMMASMRLSRQK